MTHKASLSNVLQRFLPRILPLRASRPPPHLHGQPHLSSATLPRLWTLRPDPALRHALENQVPPTRSASRELNECDEHRERGRIVGPTAQPPAAVLFSPDGVSRTLVLAPHRKAPVSFAYRTIGSGPIRVVFIAGLAADSLIWHRQIEHFASNPNFTLLIFDAWGVGYSQQSTEPVVATEAKKDDEPLTTRLMAQDVAAFLASIGWTSFHAVGSSLGGMVLMQLCLVADPSLAIRSATFLSTSSGLSLPKLQVIYNLSRTNRTNIRLEDECRRMMFLNHPAEYLEAPSTLDPRKRNMDVLAAHWFYRRQVVPRTALSDVVAHARAGARHWVPRNRLRRIAERLNGGRDILVVAGTKDLVINPNNAIHLARCFGPDAKLALFRDGGHSIQDQMPREFNALLEQHLLESQTRLADG